MAELRFKHLTIDNWLEPDPVLSAFVLYSLRDGSSRTVTGEQWAQGMLAVGLSDHVPLEVQRLFAVARGALVYGSFFYPLYTLGVEQLFRVAEAAVKYKCRQLGASEARRREMSFHGGIAYLVEQGIIAQTAQPGWDALRHLRNLASHPEDQTILPPGVAIDELRRIAADIDALFPK